MPIKWSALRVTEAMDMAEEFVKEADLPLEQAKIVATEARKIANLPGYLDDCLNRLIDQIERIDYIKSAIKSLIAYMRSTSSGYWRVKIVMGSMTTLLA